MEAIGWARTEMAGAQVWDPRCRHSLAKICARLAAHPEHSFSAAVGSDGRQAAHRIFEHPTSEPAALLAGHFDQTAARCPRQEWVLVAQDTTEFNYTSHKQTQGLGPLSHHQQRGLLCHSALAMTVAGEPLGLLHVDLWARDEAALGQKHARRKRTLAEKESQKWIDALRSVEGALPAEQPVWIVADREADVFGYLATPRRENTHLLIRAAQPRRVTVAAVGEDGKSTRGSLLAVARSAPIVGQMRVTVPRQPGRKACTVELEVRAIAAQVQAPKHTKAGEAKRAQPVHLISAAEIGPPVGEQPIHWILISTLPVTTGEEACQRVQYYARRWLIERLHFVLKSGCRVERLQVDDAASLSNALGLYYVVAWRLLWLTHVARTQPETPVEAILGEEERLVLEQATQRPVRTVREAVRGIAKLGGFAGTPSEGEPGVKSLWLGIRRLEGMVEGWRLAVATFFPTIHG